MTFTGVNYLAILIAAVAAWLAGAVWYMALAQSPGPRRSGARAEQMEERKRQPGAFRAVRRWRSSPSW